MAQLTDEEFDRIYGPWASPTPAAMSTLLAGFARPWSGVLTPLPSTEPLPDDRHQVWVRRSPGEPWLLDVQVSPADGNEWICRRNASIRLPLSEVGLRTADGVPYLRPEIVLLFKAVHLEARDAADFEALLPVLDEHARQLLAESLRATYPDHEWIARLDR